MRKKKVDILKMNKNVFDLVAEFMLFSNLQMFLKNWRKDSSNK
jgi:hypothetical protein